MKRTLHITYLYVKIKLLCYFILFIFCRVNGKRKNWCCLGSSSILCVCVYIIYSQASSILIHFFLFSYCIVKWSKIHYKMYKFLFGHGKIFCFTEFYTHIVSSSDKLLEGKFCECTYTTRYCIDMDRTGSMRNNDSVNTCEHHLILLLLRLYQKR